MSAFHRHSSRSGRSALVVVVLVCLSVFVVFGIAGSLGVAFNSGWQKIVTGDWSGFHFGSGQLNDIDRTVSSGLEGIDRIEIHTVSTDPGIVTGGDVNVEAVLKGSYTSFGGALDLTQERVGSTLRIRMKYPRFGLVDTNLDFTITIPATYTGALHVEGVSSSIRIADPGFTCTDFSASTVSGDIRISSLKANAYDISTTSGDCVLTGVDGLFRGYSVSGEMSVEVDTVASFHVNTVSGDTTLSLPAGSEFGFEFQTVSGDFQNSFESFLDKTQGKSVSGHVGGGGTSFAVQSVSGDFHITHR
jgi:hypothetical protein